MKKMKLVFAALIAACAVAFTGCPEVHSDVEWGFTQPEYLVGTVAKDSSTNEDFSAWSCKAVALNWSSASPSIATVVFTYKTYGEWDASEGQASFKFIDGGAATAEYCASDVTATNNGDLKFDLSKGNIFLSGLTVGKTYTLTITAAAGEKPALSIEAN